MRRFRIDRLTDVKVGSGLLYKTTLDSQAVRDKGDKEDNEGEPTPGNECHQDTESYNNGGYNASRFPRIHAPTPAEAHEK